MTRRFIILLFLPILLWAGPEKPAAVATVIPMMPTPSAHWTVGQDIWLEAAYLASPKGTQLFREPGEKLWWIGEIPVLLLGSSGYSLPAAVSNRATVWVQLYEDGIAIGQPISLQPRRDRVSISADKDANQAALAAGLAGVDATYLAQVANFLAGNLSGLDVTATSYSVMGFGTVIDSNGEWVGPAISAQTTLVYLMRHAETTGVGSNPPLSAEGLARVANLQAFFDNVTVDAFYSSHLDRTIQTVEPLATARGLTVNVIPNGDPATTVTEILARPGETLVIAGHSNTVPDMIQRLGGPALTIGKSEYNNLFLLVIRGGGPDFQHLVLDP